MFFKYDKDKLLYDEVCLKTWTLYLISVLILMGFTGYLIGKTKAKEVVVEQLQESEVEIIIAEVDSFSVESFTRMLKDLNVQYPHIVMAQSIVETGHWKSHIFLENHNLFGMKQAKRRITTAEGTSRNHAYYNHWRESVYDYAFYQCRYLSKINSEEEYFEYLGASYAEAPNYVNVLKSTIHNEGLKELFD